MTDEIKNVEQTEVKCLCQSKGFRKFLVIASGTFVGVFCALSLFAALHKPPMMYPGQFKGHMMRPAHCHCQYQNFHKGKHMHKCEFKKQMHKKFEKQFENKVSPKTESK